MSRFDGSRFVTYRIGERDAPPSIEGLTETRDGTYWITTSGGLFRFKPDAVSGADTARTSSPTLNAEFIDSRRGPMLEDHRGNLWYASGVLYRVEQKDGKVSFDWVKLNLPAPGGGVIGMSEARDGSLWMTTTIGLARRLPDGRVIFYPTKTAGQLDITACLVDAKDRVWYVLGTELYVLMPESLDSLASLGQLTIRPLAPTYVLPATTEMDIRLPEKEGEILRFAGKDFLARDPGHRLYRTSDQHIWLSSDRELVEFDGRAFHRFSAEQGLPSRMVQMAEDSAGNLWIGGQTALIRLDRKGLTSFGEADGFHSASVHVINETKDGTLFFADADFYVNRFDGKHFQAARPALQTNPRLRWTSRYAFLDSRNEWWILTTERLYRFAASDLTKPLAIYTSRDGLKSDSMFQIFEDKRGDIWVSVQPPDSANNGLARFDRVRNRFQTFTEDDGFPPGKSVSSFVEDKNGNLWLGFYEGGIARWADNRFITFGEADGLPRGVMTDLLVDRNGRLWISSSGGGVRRIDDPGSAKPNFVLLTVDGGLSSNNIRTITEDHFGNIYLGTVRGIDRISPETSRIKHYSISDGLAGDFVVDSHCDKNGVLWFATTNGLSRLTPTADETYVPPAIWIGGLRVAGISQSLPELGANELAGIELSHTQSNLQIDFFALDFHPGENLRYQYRLEGADTDWSAPSEQRTVTFPNLRPGSYRFLVRAVNAQGLASEVPAVVGFRILSPIWLRWWFIGIASAVVVAVAFAIIRQRTARSRERERARDALREAKEERLRELEQVRRRIAADLHDDIGSNLTRISLISEVVQRKLDGADTPVSNQLSNIGKLSRELVDSMGEIVWAINPNKDHLSDLSQKMRHFASDLLTARQIDFAFCALDFDSDIKVGANVRREFFLIFKEAVNNIARHSDCTECKIDLHMQGDQLVLTLSDDGKGFDISEKAMGHGLVSMNERIRSLGGELEISSAPGKGTMLKFVIPIRPDARQLH